RGAPSPARGGGRGWGLAWGSIELTPLRRGQIRLPGILLYDAPRCMTADRGAHSLAFEQQPRPAAGFHNIARAFAHRNYRVYLSGNGVSLIGWWLQRVAVGWLAWTLTHSGTWLGLVSLADFLPVLVLSPFAGVLADRHDRVGIIRLSQLAGCAQASLLAVLVWTDWITIELLFAVTTIGTRGFIELFPGFADSVFGRGPQGLAMLTSTVGLGAIFGGAWMVLRPAIAGLAAVVFGHTLMMALAILAFTATDRFYLALPCVFVACAAMTITGTGAQTLIQAAVEPGMRGRVMALYGMIFRAGPAVGAVLMGWASEHLGLRLALAI